MAGILGFVCSTGDSLKGWCGSASAAVIQKLSDKEFQDRMGPIVKDAAIIGCQEGVKSIPGGPLLFKIVSQSFGGEKK